MKSVHNLHYKGKNTRIAIIDEGFHPHISLPENRVTICEIYLENGIFKERHLEYSNLENSTYQEDYPHCHATAVAGVAVGKPYSSTWVYGENKLTGYSGGVAPEAKLKVFIIKMNAEAHGYLNYALKLIAEDDDKFDVVSISLRGGDQCNDDNKLSLERGKLIENILNIQTKGTHLLATSGELLRSFEGVINVGSLTDTSDVNSIDVYCFGEVQVPCYVQEHVISDVVLPINIKDKHTKMLQNVAGPSFAASAFAGLVCLIMQHVKKVNDELVKKVSDELVENLKEDELLIKNFSDKGVLLKAVKGLDNESREVRMVHCEFFETDASSIFKYTF